MENNHYYYERPKSGFKPLFDSFSGGFNSFHLVLLFCPIALVAAAFDLMSGDTIGLIFKVLIMFWAFQFIYNLSRIVVFYVIGGTLSVKGFFNNGRKG